VLITFLVYRGVKESRNFSNLMVAIKLGVVLLIILVGGYLVFQLDLTSNWMPINEKGVHAFMPNGFNGVMAAVAGVFFAYVGFDAVSVLAEESKNPQRDLPRGMIYSLVICTVIYILLTMVLSGAAHYSKFEGVGDPLAFIFEKENLNVGWMQFLVSACAVVAMTSVMLVFQMGQPRIWMSMSRDGLFPPIFQKVHPKFNTPSFSTVVTGLVVGVPLIFTDKSFVLDFTSLATLFAFVLVCGGVLLLPKKTKEPGKFHLPYISSRIVFPLIILASVLILNFKVDGYFSSIFTFEGVDDTTLTYNVSAVVFWIITALLAIGAIIKNWSLIPLMGLVTCLYLLTGMSASNWAWFASWLVLGLVIYFFYGYRKSKLAIEG
jgi:amino acid transporter